MNRPQAVLASFLASAGLVVSATAAPVADGAAAPQDAPVVVQLVVKVDGPAQATITTLATDLGLVLDDALLASRGIYLVHSTDPKVMFNAKKAAELAKRLSKRDDVVYAEVNEEIGLHDAQFSGWPFGEPSDVATDPGLYTGQWSAKSLNLDQAHGQSLGADTVVAVLDTGVDATHPALAGRVEPGWNYVDDDADTRDVATDTDTDGDGVSDSAVGHGTYVAGIVGLVAPSASILPYRVLDSDGIGNRYVAAQAIMDATAAGADVINLSFGTSGDDASRLIEDVIKAADRAGVIVVAAAGNDGTNKKKYPAAQPEVLSVSAVDSVALADFSSRGDWVDVGAPGVNIVGPLPGGRYALWAGTSAAAPFVSGEVALMRAVAPRASAKFLRDAVSRTGRKLKPQPGVKDAKATTIDILAGLAFVSR